MEQIIKCSIYEFPQHQCNGFPKQCRGCDWREDNPVTTKCVDTGLMWRRAKAGRALGKDAIVIYDGDPDARLERCSLVKCAIKDCRYIYIEDLLKLPTEDEVEKS